MQIDYNSGGCFQQSWKLGISQKESSLRKIQPRVIQNSRHLKTSNRILNLLLMYWQDIGITSSWTHFLLDETIRTQYKALLQWKSKVQERQGEEETATSFNFGQFNGSLCSFGFWMVTFPFRFSDWKSHFRVEGESDYCCLKFVWLFDIFIRTVSSRRQMESSCYSVWNNIPTKCFEYYVSIIYRWISTI